MKPHLTNALNTRRVKREKIMSRNPIKVLMANSASPQPKGEQCDCACAESTSAILPALNSGTFLGISNLYYQKITPEYEMAFNPNIGNGMMLINSSAKELLKAFSPPRPIKPADQSQIVNQMIGIGLLTAPNVDSEIQLHPTPNMLGAWLHLTDRCNLRCSYCYLPHAHQDISLKTGRAVLDAVFRSAVVNGFKQIKLKYAGGEPLLRFSLLQELHSYAQQLAEWHGLQLDGIVLSNGTLLTAEMITTLKKLDLRLMISLDGLGQHHDNLRPYQSGRGSFADVAAAIDLAILHGLPPNISVTVGGHNVEGLPDLLHWILARNLPYNLNFYRPNDLSALSGDLQLDERKMIRGMLAAFKVIEQKMPRQSFLAGLIDRADFSTPHTHTCGVGQNYLVFNSMGQAAKCQMHIQKPITDVHAEDPLAVIRADQTGISNLSVKEKEGCQTCEWKYWCAGGCPLTTYRATGRYDVKSPNCNIYKALYPEVLRLEGLRLLKYQNDPEVVSVFQSS